MERFIIVSEFEFGCHRIVDRLLREVIVDCVESHDWAIIIVDSLNRDPTNAKMHD